MGGEVLGSGGNNIGRLNRDDGTVGVSDESGVGESSNIGESSIGQSSRWSDDSTSSSELSLGSSNSGLIHRDNSTVGVSHESSVWVAISSSVWVSSQVGVSSIGQDWVDHSSCSSELSLGSSHGRLVSRDHGTVGVGDQLGGGDGDSSGENLENKRFVK